MIAKLKGLVEAIGEDHVVVDVGGVGYLVACSAKTLQRLPPLGEAVALDIETRVSEDAIRLYGFLSGEERGWFRLLQEVQGVGAKVALSILTALAPEALATAIRTGDKAAIARAQGVGPKLAQRIAMELKDKAPQPVFGAPGAPDAAPSAGTAPPGVPVAGGVAREALSALTNLGYRPAEAERAVATALDRLGAETPVGELIRHALRELAR